LAGGARALRSWLRACGGRAFLADNSAKGGLAANSQAEALLRAVNANLANLAKRRRAESAAGSSADSRAEARTAGVVANGAGGSEGSVANRSAEGAAEAEVGYSTADFERHAASLTEAQRRALAEPHSPETQAAAATALQGEVRLRCCGVGG
jgi:hypothetical protein